LKRDTTCASQCRCPDRKRSGALDSTWNFRGPDHNSQCRTEGSFSLSNTARRQRVATHVHAFERCLSDCLSMARHVHQRPMSPDPQRYPYLLLFMLRRSALFRVVRVRTIFPRGGRRTHNAGVAGSSRAPAIDEPIT